jgi:hypothetical protein
MSTSGWVAAHFTLTAGGGLPVRALRDGVQSRRTTAPRLPALPLAGTWPRRRVSLPEPRITGEIAGETAGSLPVQTPHGEAGLAVVASGSGSAGVQPVSGLACSRAGLSMSGEGMKDLYVETSRLAIAPREQGARSPNLDSLHIDVQPAPGRGALSRCLAESQRSGKQPETIAGGTEEPCSVR